MNTSWIFTVRESRVNDKLEAYIVNGNMHVPIDPNNLNYQAVVEWLQTNELEKPQAKTLAQAQTEAIARIYAFTKAIRVTLSGNAEAERMVGWVEKEKRARRVLDNTATENDKKQLQIEAEARGYGETIQKLAARQIELSDALALQNAEIDGMESHVIYLVKQCKKTEEIEPILQSFKAQAEARFDELKPFNAL